MSDSASTTTLQVPERIPTGDDVYDALMGAIEPELVTTNIPLLEEKYKGETEEEKSARFARYEQAFVQYDASFAEWSRSLRRAVDDYRRSARGFFESEDRSADEAAMRLEAAMS